MLIVPNHNLISQISGPDMKPSLADFTTLAKKHRYIPLSVRIMGDTLTPVKVYQSIRAVSPYTYLLESVQQNEKLGRFSWIGLDPLMVFESEKRQITVRSAEGVKRYEGNPLDELFTVMEAYRPVLPEELYPYQGGVVGYFGYDTIRHFEQIPDKNPDQLGIPDSLLILPKTVIVFDHLYQSITLITLLQGTGNDSYRQGEQVLEDLLNRIAHSAVETQRLEEEADTKPIDFTSNMSRKDYIAAVKKAKHYILEGDIFQVVLSQRLSVPFDLDAFELYRSLRRINPSPYLFYLSYPEFQIAGSSPEILVKRNQNTLTLRPIAGTRKRGETAEENARIAEELLNDPKEIAEHMMLVDLGRNDLGRISKFGSVKPTQFKYIENYSHVMHIVTNLESTLQEGKSNSDLIKATFPAGTLTGAPKVRAMEIIDELETTRRGFYGGAVVNIDFNGNFDSCIGIRSVLVKNGKAYIQAGAGIVADSVPEKEYDESINKATAVIQAIQLARRNTK
jgi:anthranilate synthase component 1